MVVQLKKLLYNLLYMLCATERSLICELSTGVAAVIMAWTSIKGAPSQLDMSMRVRFSIFFREMTSG